MVLTLFLSSIGTRGQSLAVAEYFHDIAGTPFFPRTYTDVNGTPYLFDDFEISNITLFKGDVLKGVKVNFNLITDELLYLDEKGSTMVASPLVVKAVETSTRKFIPTQAKNAFWEVASTEGKAMLIRINTKRIVETKAFNSATAEKNFVFSDSYAVLVGTQLTEVKSVNDLYEVLGDSLKDFAKTEKLRPKSVSSWIKIVDHYNSI
jgi:hypothetical protein